VILQRVLRVLLQRSHRVYVT